MSLRGPRTIFFSIYSKNLRKLRFLSFFHLYLEKTYEIINFTWSGLNSQDIVILVPFIYGSSGIQNTLEKNYTTSYEFSPPQVKLWYHVFSSMKMEEYMESKLSCNFRAKLVVKNRSTTTIMGFFGPRGPILCILGLREQNQNRVAWTTVRFEAAFLLNNRWYMLLIGFTRACVFCVLTHLPAWCSYVLSERRQQILWFIFRNILNTLMQKFHNGQTYFQNLSANNLKFDIISRICKIF